MSFQEVVEAESGSLCVTARVFALQVRRPHHWNPRLLGYVLNRQFTR